MKLDPEQLDARAVLVANELLWAANSELKGRYLTAEDRDTHYRQEWIRHYQAAAQETAMRLLQI